VKDSRENPLGQMPLTHGVDLLIERYQGRHETWTISNIPLVTGREYDQFEFVSRWAAFKLAATDPEHYSISLDYSGRGENVKNFWVQFAIQEALTVLSAFVASPTIPLTDQQKAAAEKLIVDGQAFLSLL
jgi:hypothetical protein